MRLSRYLYRTLCEADDAELSNLQKEIEQKPEKLKSEIFGLFVRLFRTMRDEDREFFNQTKDEEVQEQRVQEILQLSKKFTLQEIMDMIKNSTLLPEESELSLKEGFIRQLASSIPLASTPSFLRILKSYLLVKEKGKDPYFGSMIGE